MCCPSNTCVCRPSDNLLADPVANANMDDDFDFTTPMPMRPQQSAAAAADGSAAAPEGGKLPHTLPSGKGKQGGKGGRKVAKHGGAAKVVLLAFIAATPFIYASICL